VSTGCTLEAYGTVSLPGRTCPAAAPAGQVSGKGVRPPRALRRDARVGDARALPDPRHGRHLDIRFDRNGDLVDSPFTVVRIVRTASSEERLRPVVDRVVVARSALLHRSG